MSQTKKILVLQAELKGQIAGYVVVYFNTYPEQYFQFPKRAFIGSIGVDENCRGQGVGKALLSGVEEEIKRRDISVIEIDVYTFNNAAEKLYDNLGYQDTKHYKRKFIK
ncbi:MAG: GNAT family N-acetyltransferase [Alphaproteobacteria bacterium]|nr:GNAT family N-acetyltransferase [Alphaproteobacteria bacterium]